MKTLNFNELQKKYLTVTLADDKETTIMIGTPTKAILDDLLVLKQVMDKMQDDSSEEIINDLYEACARAMSRNKTNTRISAELLAECLDFEDIVIFFNAYMDFISEVTSSKN